MDKLGLKSNIYERSILNEKNRPSYIQSKKSLLATNKSIKVHNVNSYDKLIQDMKKESFFDENIIEVAMNNHALHLSREKDSKGEYGYFLYNPHNQGLPIKFDNIDKLSEFLSSNAKSVIATPINSSIN